MQDACKSEYCCADNKTVEANGQTAAAAAAAAAAATAAAATGLQRPPWGLGPLAPGCCSSSRNSSKILFFSILSSEINWLQRRRAAVSRCCRCCCCCCAAQLELPLFFACPTGCPAAALQQQHGTSSSSSCCCCCWYRLVGGSCCAGGVVPGHAVLQQLKPQQQQQQKQQKQQQQHFEERALTCRGSSRADPGSATAAIATTEATATATAAAAAATGSLSLHLLSCGCSTPQHFRLGGREARGGTAAFRLQQQGGISTGSSSSISSDSSNSSKGSSNNKADMSRSSSHRSPTRRSRSRYRGAPLRRKDRYSLRGGGPRASVDSRRGGVAPHPQASPQRNSKRHGRGSSGRAEWQRERERPWTERDSSRQQQRQQQQQQQHVSSHRSSRKVSADRASSVRGRREAGSRERDALCSSRQRDRPRDRDRDRDRGGRDRDRHTKGGPTGGRHPAEFADAISVSDSPRASQRHKVPYRSSRKTEALWRPPHREEPGSRRGPHRMSGSRSRTSSWGSSNGSSMGSTTSAAAAGYRRAAAAEPAMSSKRSSRNNRRETEYMMTEGKPYRTVNGNPPGPAGGPSSRADAPATSPPPGGSSSKHKHDGRSRREGGGATGGTGSKKGQQHQQQQQQRQGSRKSERKQHKESNRDEITHFSWEPGMWLNDRYRVLAKLGDGTFGRVLKCADVRLQTHVAIKVVRDVARYTSAARIEADILREVNRKDRRRESHCVSLLDAFMHHQRHMCLVFECLGKSLYDVLLENKYRGFYVADIVDVARQGLMALSFMRDCKLAHTDLKPENILLQGEEMVETRPPRVLGNTTDILIEIEEANWAWWM
ncbi:hypothetical protein ACSSS7_004775 [Eimeria intestinalis]